MVLHLEFKRLGRGETLILICVKIVEGIALSCVGSMSCIECVSCVEFIRLCPDFVWGLYLFVCCVFDALCEKSSKLQWWMIVKRHDCKESSYWGSW